MKNIANYITLGRMLLSISLFFLEPFSLAFLIIFGLCGITDIFDGMIARKLKIESSFGSRLDSAADIIFVVVSVIKMIPVIFKEVDIVVFLWAGIVLVIKLLSLGIVCLKYNTFGMIHTYMNKVAGITLFITPFFIRFFTMPICIICLIITTVAALEELLINVIHNDLDLNRHSLFGENIN